MDETFGPLRRMIEKITELASALIKFLDKDQPKRFIRLQVAAVRFIEVGKDTTMPNESFALDVPAGKIARIQFAPVNEKLEKAKIDGPLEAKVLDDPTQLIQPPAEVAVGGVDGLTLDIKLPDTADGLATVEVGADVDNDPANREVLTTMITLRRLGDVPGKAVSLGAKKETVELLDAAQFGQFPTAPAEPQGARRRG